MLRQLSAPALLLVAGALAGPASAQLTFLPRVDYGLADAHPIQSAVADFDKDGRLDVAVTLEGFGSGKVQVLWGDVGADFGTDTNWNRPGCSALAVGDFDGDTWPDLVVGTAGFAQQLVTVHRNDHQRGFVQTDSVYSLATSIQGLVTGDLDGDGDVDFATCCATGGNAVDWFKGNGDGTFGSFNSVPYTNGLSGSRLVCADLDLDGDQDLVLAHASGVKVLLNTGNVNDWFHPPVPAFPGTGAVQDLVARDLDGDALPELVTVTPGGEVRVWRGAGGGVFTALAGPYAAGGGAHDLRVSDLDGDGVLDVLVVGTGGFDLFLGTGGGALGAPQHLDSGLEPQTGVAGDWDNDGRTDLAAACNNAGQDAYLSVHLQQGHPPAVVYCTTKVNSQGCFPSIASSGQAQLSGTAAFDVSASYVINQQFGILYYGFARAAVPFQGGTRCVASPFVRTPPQNSGGTVGVVNCSGTFTYDFNARIRSGIDPALVPGVTVDAQWWYRDPASPSHTGLTDAIEFTIAP